MFSKILKIRSRFEELAKVTADRGIVGGAAHAVARVCEKLGCDTVIMISRYAKHPLRCRVGSSDAYVFEQIFVEREYACLDDLKGVDLVIDCGAYVGYSAAYFLSQFPRSYVVAVEPEPENFKLLTKNLAPYKGRVDLIQSAVSSHSASLKMREAMYRDGQAWSKQVRECTTSEVPTVPAIDISTILQRSGRERISILKVDIEGAEQVLFGQKAPARIGSTKSMQ